MDVPAKDLAVASLGSQLAGLMKRWEAAWSGPLGDFSGWDLEPDDADPALASPSSSAPSLSEFPSSPASPYSSSPAPKLPSSTSSPPEFTLHQQEQGPPPRPTPSPANPPSRQSSDRPSAPPRNLRHRS